MAIRDSILEPEPHYYSFPKIVWDLLVKYNIVELSDGFDSTESFRDHTDLLFKIDVERLNNYPTNIAFSYTGAMLARDTMINKHPDSSDTTRNVFAGLMFHLFMETKKNNTDIRNIEPHDLALMLGALLEILNAPIDDTLKKNL